MKITTHDRDFDPIKRSYRVVYLNLHVEIKISKIKLVGFE